MRSVYGTLGHRPTRMILFLDLIDTSITRDVISVQAWEITRHMGVVGGCGWCSIAEQHDSMTATEISI